MKFKPKRTTILFLLVASLVGFLVSEVRIRTYKLTSQEEIDEWYGMESGDDSVALQSPITLNDVAEGVHDENNDNRVDSRTVLIFPNQDHHAMYSAYKIDQPEWFPRLMVRLGKHNESVIRLSDDDKDGDMDSLHVMLRDHRKERTIGMYADHNMDGLLDEMIIRDGDLPLRRYILLDYAWVETHGPDGNPWGATQWIDEGGTELQRMDFDGTKWVRTNDPGDIEGQPANPTL